MGLGHFFNRQNKILKSTKNIFTKIMSNDARSALVLAAAVKWSQRGPVHPKSRLNAVENISKDHKTQGRRWENREMSIIFLRCGRCSRGCGMGLAWWGRLWVLGLSQRYGRDVMAGITSTMIKVN